MNGTEKVVVTPAALAAAAKGDMVNALIASTPGGIEAQEARGQQDLVSTFDRLPRMGPGYNEIDRAQFERIGFKFGAAVDNVFVSVTPPAGWTMKPTDHSMWNRIVDDKGRERASVFYKAAFYDRSAHIRLSTRYCVKPEYRGEHPNLERRYLACDGEAVLNSEPWESAGNSYRIQYEQCAKFLFERFPDWENPEAYWD